MLKNKFRLVPNMNIRLNHQVEKLANDLRIGDELIDHNGKISQIIEISKSKYCGCLTSIFSKSFPFNNLFVDETEILVPTSSQKWRWVPNDTKWDTIGKLSNHEHFLISSIKSVSSNDVYLNVNDYLGKDYYRNISKYSIKNLKKIKNKILVNKIFGSFVGFYLAEGHSDVNKIEFTFNKNENTYISEVLECGYKLFGIYGSTSYRSSRNTVSVSFHSKILADFIKILIPGNCYNKKVPNCILNSTSDVQEACLISWLKGDGHWSIHNIKNSDKKRLRLEGNTVSEQMCRDFSLICISLGFPISIHKGKSKENTSSKYTLSLSGHDAYNRLTDLGASINDFKLPKTRSRMMGSGYIFNIDKIDTNIFENFDVIDIKIDGLESIIQNSIITK